MQFARFLATLGLLLVLGLAGLAAGCGGDSQQGTTAKVDTDGKTVKEQMKQEHLDLQAERKGTGAGSPKKGRNR
jgi:hypothetical protein